MSDKQQDEPSTAADSMPHLQANQHGGPLSATTGNYKVDRIEVVMRTDDVLARVFNLVPGDRIPRHVHKLSSDHYFVLSGVLTIKTNLPSRETVLAQGERWRVDPGTEHEVLNAGTTPVSFLLLQGTGGYDWIKVEK